jgi:hypothetical protein
MSAISFGGSFELVRSGDETWKKIMSKVLSQAAIRAFPIRGGVTDHLINRDPVLKHIPHKSTAVFIKIFLI